MNYLSFKEFVEKYGLKDEATSNVKIKEILDTLSSFGTLKLNSTGIYMRDDKFTTTSGIVNLHPTKGTHWVMFSDKFYAHLQLIYLITLKKVSIQNIKFRKLTVIAQPIVCTCCISQKYSTSKMQF